MRIFGLIGKPLTHSFSQSWFTDMFARQHITDAVYNNFELNSIDELPGLVSSQPDLVGLNVTIPYKESILPFLDIITKEVETIKACNCLKVENGLLTGHNTDTYGFESSLLPNLQDYHNKALILGTGGASKAVSFVLEKLGIVYSQVSRSGKSGLSYEDLDADTIADHSIIINTTPVGMFPDFHSYPAMDYSSIGKQHLLFDLIYNPSKTRFLQKGEERGAKILNGYNMLVVQAEESWRIWNQ